MWRLRSPAVSLIGGLLLLIWYLETTNQSALRTAASLGELTLRDDALMQLERRFQPLGDTLPRHAVVGWMTDAGDVMVRHFHDQYVLAPKVLDVHDDCCDLVVADFNGDPFPRAASLGLHLVKHFGGSLYLFSK